MIAIDSIPMSDADFLMKGILAISLIANVVVILRKATGKPERQIIEPQPFIVTLEKQFVDKSSFHKHAELNRQAHEKLEQDLRRYMTTVDDKIQHVLTEVTRVAALREENGDRLRDISDQLKEVSSEVSTLSGVVHQMNRASH